MIPTCSLCLQPVNLDKSTLTSHKNKRSNATAFDFKQNCLFYGIFVDQKESFEHPNRGIAQLRFVMEIEFEKTIKNHCAQRLGEWAVLVQSRILAVFDLPAANANYHPRL